MRSLLSCCCIVIALLAAHPATARDDAATVVARGKALTDAGDCASCHTADASKPFAGGRKIGTPFGAIYSPNLTPDRDTGIGTWNDEDFYRAMHDGIAPDGSRYYPAFPYPTSHTCPARMCWRSKPISRHCRRSATRVLRRR